MRKWIVGTNLVHLLVSLFLSWQVEPPEEKVLACNAHCIVRWRGCQDLHLVEDMNYAWGANFVVVFFARGSAKADSCSSWFWFNSAKRSHCVDCVNGGICSVYVTLSSRLCFDQGTDTDNTIQYQSAKISWSLNALNKCILWYIPSVKAPDFFRYRGFWSRPLLSPMHREPPGTTVTVCRWRSTSTSYAAHTPLSTSVHIVRWENISLTGLAETQFQKLTLTSV